jgi:hypothetical protein
VFYEQGDPFLLGLHATAAKLLKAKRKQTRRNRVPISKVTALHIETLDPHDEDHRDLDHEHTQQLRSLLQQMQFPQMQILYLDFGHWYGLHFAGSQNLWTALSEAFAKCHSPVLQGVQLSCRMIMNDRAIGYNLCVSQGQDDTAFMLRF